LADYQKSWTIWQGLADFTASECDPAPLLAGHFGRQHRKLYAHEIGGSIQDNDTSTGISFGPTSEAYHLAKWTGIFVIAPLIWFVLFVVYDSLFGDLRTTPWGLLAMAMISQIAPEGGITDLIYLLTYGSEILVFCAVFARWVAPIIAVPVLGPDRQIGGLDGPTRSTHPLLGL
jgi:hypothetical protein